MQETICEDIEKIEGRKNFFRTKKWKEIKEKWRCGEFRIFNNGKVFDKVGVNFSKVYGKLSEQFKNKIPGTKKTLYQASGISVVMHMKNPHIPAMHFNTRYIYTSHGWFGGGIDVTPCFKNNNQKWIFIRSKKYATNIIKIIIKI